MLLNDDDLGYALVRFDPRSLATLAESIGQFDDSLARAVCWSAVLDMAAAGANCRVPAFVRILAARDGTRAVGLRAADPAAVTGRLLTMTGGPAPGCRRARRNWPTRRCELLRAAEPGSDLQLAWAQLLGWTAATPEPARPAGRAAGRPGRGAWPGVDTELRWALLRRLASHRPGRRRGDRRRAGPRRHRRGPRHAAACRAAIPDAEHKAAAWRLLTESAELGSKARRGRAGLQPGRARRAARPVRGEILHRGAHGWASPATMRVVSGQACSRTRPPRPSCWPGPTRSWPAAAWTRVPPGSDRGPRRRREGAGRPGAAYLTTAHLTAGENPADW